MPPPLLNGGHSTDPSDEQTSQHFSDETPGTSGGFVASAGDDGEVENGLTTPFGACDSAHFKWDVSRDSAIFETSIELVHSNHNGSNHNRSNQDGSYYNGSGDLPILLNPDFPSPSTSSPRLLQPEGTTNSHEAIKSFKKLSGAAHCEGVEFEQYTVMLVYLRLLASGMEFLIGSNIEAATPFDDIVVRYRADATQPWKCTLLQLKHKLNTTVITEKVLLKLNDDFSLVKYCNAYFRLTRSDDVALRFLSESPDKTFIIFTNSDVIGSTGKTLTEADDDAILNTGAVRYFAQNSTVFGQLCDWVAFKDVVCTLNEEIEGQQEAEVRSAVERSLSVFANCKNNAIKMIVRELLKNPTSNKINETLANLQVVRDNESYSEFLAHLLIYTKQAHGKKLEDEIKKCLASMFHFTKDSERDAMYLVLVEKVKSWRKNDKKFLTQDSPIWLDLVKKHIGTLSTGKLDKQKVPAIDYLDASIDAFLSLLSCWASGEILNVIVDFRTTASSVKVLSALARCWPQENILRVDLTTLSHREDEVMTLWSTRWCRALVVECDTELSPSEAASLAEKIVEVVVGNVARKVAVIIGRQTNRLTEALRSYRGNKDHRDMCQWSQLTATSQEKLLSVEVVLQGSGVLLGTLVRDNQMFFDQCNGDVISQLLCGGARCGQELEPVGKIFVPRRVRASDGDLFPVEDVVEKVVLVVAGPGMGKSTLINHLAHSAKKRDPTAWIVHVKLGDCTQHLTMMELDCSNGKAAKKIMEKISLDLRNSLEVALFRSLERNLVVFVDGVDEVCPRYEQQALTFLSQLTGLKIRQLWVSSRPFMRAKLESVLKVPALVLDPFTENDQFLFFETSLTQEFPSIEADCLESYTDQLISVVSATLKNSSPIWGVPLMASMVAEVFNKGLRLSLPSADHLFEFQLDVMVLYSTFMQKCFEKTISSLVIRQVAANFMVEKKARYKEYKINHQLSALIYIFHSDQISGLKFKKPTDINKAVSIFLEKRKEGVVCQHLNVINSDFTDGTPYFVHRTFAEYFVASWLADNFKNNKNFVENIIFSPSFAWISDMFSRILARGHPLHTAVMNRDFEKVTLFLKEEFQTSSRRNSLDAGGRTPMHLAALLSGSEQKLDILHLLVERKARVDVADHVLGWRPLRYADRAHDWSAAGVILSNGGSDDDMESIRSIENSTRRAFIDFLKQPPTAAPGVSLMLAAARNAGVPVVRFLVEERGGDVHCRGPLGETMVHMAAAGGDVELLKYLCDLGTSLNAEDSEYVTPLTYAVRRGKTATIRFLLEARRHREQAMRTTSECERTATVGRHETPCNRPVEGDGSMATLDDGLIEVVNQGHERIVLVLDSASHVHRLQLALFRDPASQADINIKILQQGNKYLFIHDENQFVAYGCFIGQSHLETIPTLDVAQAKKAVFDEFRISKVLCDSLTDSRDYILQDWKETVALIAAKSNCRAVVEMIKIQKKFGAGCDSSMKILEHIRKVSTLPDKLKQVSGLLFDKERQINARNAKFACFDNILLGNLCLSGVSQTLLDTCSAAVKNHYQSLAELLKDTGPFGDQMLQSLGAIPKLLRFTCQDINLFKGLDSTAKKLGVSDQLAGVFRQMWNTFVANVNSQAKSKTLTTPVYQFLFTSFLETVKELSDRTSRTVCDSPDALLKVQVNSWTLRSINWPAGASIQDRALEVESRFLAHTLMHVKPGQEFTSAVINNCSTCTPTSSVFCESELNALDHYKDTAMRGSSSTEPLIWITVLHQSMHFLASESDRKENECIRKNYREMLTSLENAYAKYLAVCKSSESCRLLAREIARFAAQMFEPIDSVVRPWDAEILHSQTNFMRSMLDSKKHGEQRYDKYLSPLIAEFVHYWKNRKDFDLTVGAKFKYDAFVKEIGTICDYLHASLGLVLVKTELAPDMIIDHFRAFNEFLTTFQQLSFVWLVEKGEEWDSELPGLKTPTVPVKNKRIYEVADQRVFVEALTAAKIKVPKHYVLTIARRLTKVITDSLKNDAVDEQTRVLGTGNLLEAIRKAFIHLDDQVNYLSNEQFEKDLCQPFESVASKMNQYADFKRHLDNLENFFVYSRRQNEIDIDKALEMFGRITGNVEDNKTIDSGVLKKSYLVYEEAFNDHISQTNEGKDILEAVRSKFFIHDHSQWDTDFRRHRIPVLLAAVSAFWSIQESVHVINTGNNIKPHRIQILCVFRLLNVDQDGQGLRKHLAEVLTGQGKSFVLALLASVLALTGHFVQIVCYSKYLAARDQLAFEEFFRRLAIREKVNYWTFDNLANNVLRIEMNGEVHHVRDLLRQMILDELPAADARETTSVESNCKASRILLVDEVDVFFTEEFYGNVYGLCVTVRMPTLVKIQEEIWRRVSARQDPSVVATEIQTFVEQIVEEDCDEQFLTFYKSSKKWFVKQLKQMACDALKVVKGEAQNELFKINDRDGILELRLPDGIYTRHTFLQYQNSFNYFRLKQNGFDHKNYKNYGYLYVDCGDVSYAELPNEYPVILGVSGTIATLSLEEKTVVRDSYGIEDVSHMPTFFGGVNLAFDPDKDFRIVDGKTSWQEAILESVRAKQQEKRAVIVFFDTEWHIDQFIERFKKELTGVNKLTGNEGAVELDRRIKDAGVARSLTLAVRAMGRGIDYRTSLTVEQHGGVHVLQTFLSLDAKEEAQIKGRTARKDNAGSYELILCKQRLVASGVLNPGDNCVDYATLHERRTTKAVEQYQKTGESVRKALEKHNKSLELIKSFETYQPSMRSGYFTKYPFV